MPDVLHIAERYCGPPGCGNGGYVSGLLAQRLGGPGEVTLRRPVPLGCDLHAVSEEGAVSLRHRDELLAEARPWLPDVNPPLAVSIAAAREASTRFPRRTFHPLPRCFVCGTERVEGDGLRIFPGPLPDSPVVAAPWTPHPSLGDDRGMVRPEFLWAALDCTGAFATNEPPRGLVLLGRLAAGLRRTVPVGETLVVSGWPIADQGRKVIAGTALHDRDGNVVGAARATWIFVEGPTR